LTTTIIAHSPNKAATAAVVIHCPRCGTEAKVTNSYHRGEFTSFHAEGKCEDCEIAFRVVMGGILDFNQKKRKTVKSKK
jgi:transposase-like protein